MRWRAFLPLAGRRRQRGAISIMAAAGLTLLLGAALLGVDLGNLSYTRRHLQTVADTAALSAVNDLAAANSIAVNAASLNSFDIPGGQNNRLETVLGSYDLTTHVFTPGGAAAMQNAVQVTVRTAQPYFFMFGQHEVSATATAVRNDIAGLQMATALLKLDAQQSVLLNALLGGLLNTKLNLDVLSYQGLLGVSVNLLDLVKVHGAVGTAEGLLALDMKLADLLELSATALGQKNLLGLDLTAIDTLHLLALKTDGGLNLKLGDLLKIPPALGDAAADIELNVMQLVTLAAQVANAGHAVNIPMLGIDLGGLAKLDVKLSIFESPSIAIGLAGDDGSGHWRTIVHTAQTRLQLNLDLLSALSLGGGSGLVHLPLYVELGSGSAWLKDIDCKAPRDSSVVTVGAETSTADIYLGEVKNDVMSNRNSLVSIDDATLVNILGLIKIHARAKVAVPSAGNDNMLFSGPFDSSNTQSVSGLATTGLYTRLIDSLVLTIDILGLPIPLGPLVDALLTLLYPVLALLDAVLNPVLSLLGIQIGVGDVTVFSLKCGVPQLVR